MTPAPAELQQLLSDWQQRLGLVHWSIELTMGDVMDNGPETVFEIQRHENAHRAVITVAPWLAGGDRPEMVETVDDRFIEQGLVHELCHLIFRDVTFIVRDDLADLLGQVNHELIMRGINRSEEAAVDLLARSLVDAWPTGWKFANNGSWWTQELDSCVVVLPLFEEGHVLGRECWCHPRVQTADEDGEPFRKPLVSHRDRLERDGPPDPEHEQS